MVLEAAAATDEERGVAEAQAAGKNFQLPTKNMLRDVERYLKHEGDLKAMGEEIMRERRHIRLSKERTDAVLDRRGVNGQRPRDTLDERDRRDVSRCEILSNGIPIHTGASFLSNGAPPKPRKIYQEVHPVVNSVFCKL